MERQKIILRMNFKCDIFSVFNIKGIIVLETYSNL